MYFFSLSYLNKNLPTILLAVLCHLYVLFTVSANQVAGSDDVSGFRYGQPSYPQFRITQDGRQVISEPTDTVYTPSLYLGQKANAEDDAQRGMFQGASFGLSYLPGWGSHGLGMTQVRVGASIGLPAPMKESFILLSPTFEPTFVRWKGTEPFPKTLYSASLSCTLFKNINERWAAMASVGPRWCSDGNETHNAVRCTLMGGMIWKKSPQWHFRFGLAYFNRNDSFNILPFGGVTWMPNEAWKYELMAPMLRIARRCHYFQTILPGQSESTHWGYAGIGFSGGTWAFQSINQQPDVANYSEFNVVVGLESERNRRNSWKTEFGYVFGRSMNFEHDTICNFHINDSIVLRVTLSI